MTTATMPTTESPTSIMRRRLAATGHTLALGPELSAWLDCSRLCGIELPAPILDLVDVAEHLAAERATVVPPPSVKPQPQLILTEGGTLADALAADAAYAAAVAYHEREEHLLFLAENHLPVAASGVFNVERDDLIVGPMRQSIDLLLEQAADAAHALREYGPAFGDGIRDRCTSQKHIDLWRESRRWQGQFEVLIKAWFASWSQGAPRDFVPTEGQPGGWLAWEAPDLIADRDLRLGKNVEILEIATAPSAYRLPAPSELTALIDHIDAQLPRDAKGKITSPLGAVGQLRRDLCGFVVR